MLHTMALDLVPAAVLLQLHLIVVALIFVLSVYYYHHLHYDVHKIF